MSFTKKHRQAIIADFERETGQPFTRAGFLDHVERVGPDHPAHSWFTWDDSEAARQHRLNQAGRFVEGLRVRFEISYMQSEQVYRQELSAPAMISPLPSRNRGGGYITIDPDNPEHVVELCRLAAHDLRAWEKRYDGVMALAGVKQRLVGMVLDRLDAVADPPAMAAE